MSKKMDEDIWKLSEEDLKNIESQIHTVTTSNTVTTTGTLTSPGITPNGFNPTYQPQYNNYPAYQQVFPVSQEKVVLESSEDGDLVNLIELLEVEPCVPEYNGIILRIHEVEYSLTSILKAQMAYMVKMNLLLIHRGLVTEIS